MFDVLLLGGVELLPVLDILSQVNFLGGPETSHLVFVQFPDVIVLDRHYHKSVRVLFKKWLGQNILSLCLARCSLHWNLRSEPTVLTVVLLNQCLRKGIYIVWGLKALVLRQKLLFPLRMSVVL